MPVEQMIYFPQYEEFQYATDFQGTTAIVRFVWRERSSNWYVSFYTPPDPEVVTQQGETTDRGDMLATKALIPGRPFAVTGIDGLFFPWGDDTQRQEDLGSAYGLIFAYGDIE